MHIAWGSLLVGAAIGLVAGYAIWYDREGSR